MLSRQDALAESKRLFEHFIEQETPQQVAILDNYRAQIREAVDAIGADAFTGAWLAYRALLTVQHGMLLGDQSGVLAALLDTLSTPSVQLDHPDLAALDKAIERAAKLARWRCRFRPRRLVRFVVPTLVYFGFLALIAVPNRVCNIIGLGLLFVSCLIPLAAMAAQRRERLRRGRVRREAQ